MRERRARVRRTSRAEILGLVRSYGSAGDIEWRDGPGPPEGVKELLLYDVGSTNGGADAAARCAPGDFPSGVCARRSRS